MSESERSIENRLRRAAARQWLQLIGSCCRDQRAYDFGGYILTNENNNLTAGGRPPLYSIPIDAVKAFLEE
jgi:hypothetical protein